MNSYEILQVSPTADDQVIRAAYRSLIQRHHPDRHPGNAEMAALAATLTQAYELLSDPERKAALDAQLNLNKTQTNSSRETRPVGQTRDKLVKKGRAQAAPAPPPLLFRVAGVVLCIGLAWAAFHWVSKRSSNVQPVQQLADIRVKIEQTQTSEAERRSLFAGKQELLLAHPELAALERTQRVSDLALRSVVLLDEPLMVSLAGEQNANLSSVRLAVPEITLVLGSFDSVQLKEHVNRHRQRIVANLTQRLMGEPAMLAFSSDSEQRLKRVIRESISASLDIRPQEAYPSTYFESPGRHGVVDVILPQSFAVLR